MIAWEALVRAIDDFDSSKGGKITSHIAQCIHWDMLKEWNKNHCMSRDAEIVSFDAKTPGKDHGSYTLHDILASNAVDPAAWTIQNETSRELHDALTTLSKIERAVVSERYMDGYVKSFAEVGETHGRTRKWANQIEKRALRKMKPQMETLHKNCATFGD